MKVEITFVRKTSCSVIVEAESVEAACEKFAEGSYEEEEIAELEVLADDYVRCDEIEE
jgi:hypothetical protein